MKEIEKYGATWRWSEHDGELRYETYDERLDLIGAVHEYPHGVYVSCLYSKTEVPGGGYVWSQAPQAQFDDLRLAVDHVRTLMAEACVD